MSGFSLEVLLGLAVGIAGAWAVFYILTRVGVIQVATGRPQPASMCPLVCAEHAAERERSLANQKAIEKLWTEFGQLRDKIEDGLDALKDQQQAILMGLVQAGVIRDYPGKP
jgi:hypothetical protein